MGNDSDNKLLVKSDDELVLLFQNGNNNAFEVLVKRYSSPIINFYYRLCWQKELAEDLAQELFIKLYCNLHSYNSKGYFKSYIYRVAKNIWIDLLRSKKAKWELGKNQANEEIILYNLKANSSSAEDELHYKEKLAILKKIIDQLPPEQKIAFILYQDDMKYNEIAQVLAIPEGTVKSRLHVVFNKLKEALFKD